MKHAADPTETRTVSEILAHEHGLTARPGQKIACPFCGHSTFSIKREDTFGKCFHPSCGRFITPMRRGSGIRATLHAILLETFFDWRAALLASAETETRGAWSYLAGERGLHRRVIEDSLLGVVPSACDIKARFDAAIAEVTARIEAAQASRGPGRPKKKRGDSDEDVLAALTAARDKLATCVTDRAGWIAFFYTDAEHRIVGIKFRAPYSKRFVWFKPIADCAGVFGHTLFSPCEHEELRQFDLQLIIVEGEVNALQLQSLALRVTNADAAGEAYVNCVAVGGVKTADWQTIRALADHPIICWDNDRNGAGLELLEDARKHFSVTGLTTPGEDSDLDSFIRSFGDDHGAAWAALRVLISARERFARDYAGVRELIFTTRQKHGPFDCRREFEINGEVAEIVIEDLNDRGQLYFERPATFFFDEEAKSLLEIDPDNPEFSLRLAKYGLVLSETIFRYVTHRLRNEALVHGKSVRIYRLAHFDAKTSTLYLYNHAQGIYRITADRIELVHNGTDGVLFLDDRKSAPFAIKPLEAEPSLLNSIIFDKINCTEDRLTAAERRLLTRYWFYAVFFEDLMPTKVILAFIGPKGSGKSITARKFGLLLFGPAFNVMPLTSDARDFDAAATASHFLAIDNADSKNEWLNDRLAVVATGGSIKRREYYTTNRMVEYPARCFLAITSRTPHFRRDDVADRLLIVKVDRFENFVSEKDLLAEVIENRDALMSEVVYELQKVIRALQNAQGAPEAREFRMGDFADFALKIAAAEGREDEVRDALRKLAREQSAFALEDDSLLHLLEVWVEANPGQEISNSDLCARLTELAKKENTPFGFAGKPRSFAQRMRALRSNLAEYFDITERPIGKHRKVYTFVPKDSEAEDDA